MRNILCVVLFLASSLVVSAQSKGSAKLKVFMDCRTGCDMRYIKTEIQIVDFVTDRLAADAHVLITAERVGSGGTRYQLNVYGQNRYRRYRDTVRFITAPTATADEERQKLVQQLLVGLVPMIAKTPYAANIVVSIIDTAAGGPAATNITRDNWNYWAFRLGMRGELSADQVYNNSMLNANFSASRTTDKLKVDFYITGSQRYSTITSEDGGTSNKITVANNDYGFYQSLVSSFNAHWSYGYQTNFSSTTFSNIRQKYYFNPAIEYNIYNYKDVNTRSFLLRYGVDVNHNNYYDTTIYDKTEETLLGHRFSAVLTLNKKWGTFFTGLSYRNYFKSWKLNSAGISVAADVRLTGNFSFFVNANGNLVHNQVSLVKGEVSEQDVLTRKRQLASSYNYYTSFGFNFRFGSILNNFVNPRFEGYGGF